MVLIVGAFLVGAIAGGTLVAAFLSVRIVGGSFDASHAQSVAEVQRFRREAVPPKVVDATRLRRPS